jgi:hypothetical protein
MKRWMPSVCYDDRLFLSCHSSNVLASSIGLQQLGSHLVPKLMASYGCAWTLHGSYEFAYAASFG